ncbi:MAG: glutathione S-transferase family protein, partial [Pseudomonadota bacterium]
LGPLGAARFVRDRLGMMRQAAISPPSGREARQKLETFIADVNTWVEGRNDIGQDLTYADFCIYHPLWLAQNIGSGSAIEAHEALANWMAHMAGLGQGKREEQEQAAAFSAAADNAPRPLPDDVETHECVCERVRIAPDDYGNVPVTGELVAVTRDRYILARETKRFGTLHVHFPRTGYRLTAS